MKTTLFKNCITVIVLCSSIACQRNKSESPMLPVSNNRSETSTSNIERLHAELLNLNTRIITLNVDVDQLKTEFDNGNMTAVNTALGYTEAGAAMKLEELKSLSTALNTEYGVTPAMFPLNPEVFNSMKRMKQEGLPDVLLPQKKDKAHAQQSAKNLSLRFVLHWLLQQV